MPDTRQIAIERAISEALEMSLPAFHKQIVEQVLTVLEPVISVPVTESAQDSASSGSFSSETLDAAITAVQSSHSQIDILDSLLEGVSKFSGRCALYVTRGSSAVGWRARGFEENEGIRSLAVEFDAPLIAKAIKHSSVAEGSVDEFDPTFSRRMSAPEDDRAFLAPLIVREKCAAIIYADSQGAGRVDQNAIWTLVRFAGLWLEIAPTRRMEILPAEEPRSSVSPTVETAMPGPVLVPSNNGSSNGTSPQVSSPVAEETSAVATAVISGPVPVPSAAPTKVNPGDPIHQKAKRFAKLLVEEIKLYNQQKVEQGRTNRDLYDRLREDIEKSRASYDKRYAATQVADSNYFNNELVRILADNDPSLLGSSFPG